MCTFLQLEYLLNEKEERKKKSLSNKTTLKQKRKKRKYWIVHSFTTRLPPYNPPPPPPPYTHTKTTTKTKQQQQKLQNNKNMSYWLAQTPRQIKWGCCCCSLPELPEPICLSFWQHELLWAYSLQHFELFFLLSHMVLKTINSWFYSISFHQALP